MDKLENDYSLSYDEYLKNFRETHHPQAVAMSKAQYEAAKAAAEQNKNNQPITLDKEAEDVYADANSKKNGTTVEQEKALNRAAMERDTLTDSVTTPKEGSMQANVDDTKAIGAIKEDLDYMLQKGQISRDAYDKQIAALQTPEVQEEMIRGENKADETVWDSSNREVADSANNNANTTLTDSVTEVTTPKKDDPPEVQNDKNRYNKAMMSIWDAYRAGEISKETAGYFTIDAIATLAKNLGRSIGNVGAQFSGGTIDNGHDESKWGQRQDALLNEEIGMETESLGGAAGRQAQSETLDLEAKRIRNAYNPKQLENQIEMFKKDLEMADINLDMAHSRTDLINFIKNEPDYAKSPFKMGLVAYLTQAGAAGAANSASKTLGDAINWILTIAK